MMKRVFFSAVLAALVGLQVSADASVWDIDPSHSTAGFKVRHLFSKVAGEFTDFSGTIEFDQKDLTATTVDVEIMTASITTQSEKRDNHLRSADFFNAEKYPTITFQSTSVTKNKEGEGWIMEGVLNMHGVEKPATLTVEFLGAGADPWGSRRAGFTATATLNRKDFGITWNKTLDAGGTMLSDDIAITIEIEAVEIEEDSGE